MIKHIVTWKLHDYANGKNKLENALFIKQALEGLKNEIEQIQTIQVGINHSQAPEQNWDVVLIIDFKSITDLEIYQEHPAHVKFKDLIKNLRELRAAVDFEYLIV